MAYDVGDVIDGHYRVERRYDGGMGHVYIVLDQIVNKRFAIKQLPESHAAEPILRERFRREASAWLQLDYHPHIVQAHTYHERLEGPVLILEYVDGPSFDELLRSEGTISPPQAVAYARQFCQAMHYAHHKEIPGRGHGVLHRDIKPSNILITRTNQLKVTDFGLAKIGGESRITREGQYVGTITYSSPEQLRAAGNVTGLSDLYSLGAVLYQATCGEVPFRAKTPAELYFAIQNDKPASLEQRCPDLNPALARCIMRCIEKEPGDRFQSFMEFEQALGALEGSVRDRRDRRCSVCGFISRRGSSRCPVCAAGSPISPVTPRPMKTGSGWTCPCGQPVSELEIRCPKCGRPRPKRVRESTQDLAPDRTLRPQARGGGIGLADSSPGATPPPVFAWTLDESRPYLVEIRGGGDVQAWVLERSGYTLGRDPKMKIRLDDPTVARYQLFLVNLPLGWLAINPQEGAAVRFNGWEARQRVLRRGDTVLVGKTWLVFTGPAPPSRDLGRLAGRWSSAIAADEPTVKSRSNELTQLASNPPAACSIEIPGAPGVVSYGQPLRIGSAPICDVRLVGSGVAPIHAVVVWQADGPHLFNLAVDLDTSVNDQPVLERLLADGDRLQVGCVPTRVRLQGELGVPARVRRAVTPPAPRALGLTVLTGPQKGQTAVLKPGQAYHLGRVSDSDVTLTHDPHVSRKHLEVTATGDTLQIRDQGSRSGFFLNQVHFAETAEARLGDVLVIGKTSLLVHQEIELEPW
jgi:pSer/pThr/pTyr-binding forkhead associated (FHA) protein/tRNA A-37 threonylcarbamoyl transferase component Bud32